MENTKADKKILNSFLLGSLIAVLVSPIVVLATDCSALNTLATSVTGTAIGIASPIVVIGWIIAGIMYLTATGNPQRMELAKKTMIACAIGTVLVILAATSGAVISVVSKAINVTPDTTCQ
jgi:hypothetical protein